MDESKLAVVQFSNFDEFLEEVRAEQPSVVRVWKGEGDRPYGPAGLAMRHHLINCQAHLPEQATVLSCAVEVGAYSHFNGKPFGPADRVRAAFVKEHADEIHQRLQAELKKLWPEVAVRPGAIHTGLTMIELQRAGWIGLNDLVEQLQERLQEA